MKVGSDATGSTDRPEGVARTAESSGTLGTMYPGVFKDADICVENVLNPEETVAKLSTKLPTLSS